MKKLHTLLLIHALLMALSLPAFGQETKPAVNPKVAEVKALLAEGKAKDAMTAAEAALDSPPVDATQSDINALKSDLVNAISVRRDEILSSGPSDQSLSDLDTLANDAASRGYKDMALLIRINRLSWLKDKPGLESELTRSVGMLSSLAKPSVSVYSSLIFHSSKAGRSDLVEQLAVEGIERGTLSSRNLSNNFNNVFNIALPGNWSARLAFVDAQEAADGLKRSMIQTTGRADGKALADAVTQLVSGGEARPFIAPPADNVYATAAETAGDAVLAAALRGQYDAAIRLEWAKLIASKSDAEYTQHAYAIAGFLRAKEQSYNGAALQFLKWVNGDVKDNPIASLIAEVP